jgi:hypothetical protein
MDNDIVSCSYPARFGSKSWQIVLQDNEIFYTADGEKKISFRVDEISEFQFEMGNGGIKHEDFPACIAYVILKSDPDPQIFFYFFIVEEYVLLNQTKAYEFGSKILDHIGNRYGIPAIYKLSIETKEKNNRVALIPLLFIVIFVLLWLRLRYLN